MQLQLSFKKVFIPVLALAVASGIIIWRNSTSKTAIQSKSHEPVVLSTEARAFGMSLLSAELPKPEYVRSQMRICFERGGGGNCYRTVADLLYKQLGSIELLAIFEAAERYEEIFSRCHEVTHYIGRLVYGETGNVATAYSTSSPVCHGGYYHGVLEQYFKDRQLQLGTITDEQIGKEVATVCGQSSDYAIPRVYSECLHGIGHAMMFVTEANLPLSLKLCDNLEQGSREVCYSGVFMENSSSSTNADHPTKYLNAADPMYPCTILDVQYLKTCYEYQSSYFAELVKWDWDEVAALCSQVPNEYGDGCFHVMGTNQAGYTQDVGVMLENCGVIGELVKRQMCVRGIVSAVGGRYVGNADRMLEVCLLAAANVQEACYGQMGKSVSGWSTDPGYRAEQCGRIENTKAREWCML